MSKTIFYQGSKVDVPNASGSHGTKFLEQPADVVQHANPASFDRPKPDALQHVKEGKQEPAGGRPAEVRAPAYKGFHNQDSFLAQPIPVGGIIAKK